MSSPFDGSVVIMADNSIIFWLNHLYTNETYWLSIASSVRDVFNESIGNSLKHHGTHSAKTGLTLVGSFEASCLELSNRENAVLNFEYVHITKSFWSALSIWYEWWTEIQNTLDSTRQTDRNHPQSNNSVVNSSVSLQNVKKIVLVPRSSRKVWWSWSEQVLQYQEKMDI